MDSKSASALMKAASRGQIKLVAHLLCTKAAKATSGPGSGRGGGDDRDHSAEEQAEAVRSMARFRDAYGNSALHAAAESGSFDCMSVMLRQWEAYRDRVLGSSPATGLGSSEDSSSLVDAQNDEGDTALHLAALSGSFDVCDILLQHGADVAVRNNHQQTPLEWACLVGRADIARLLIEAYGCDIACVNANGETPLHVAMVGGRDDLVRLLLRCGADAAALDTHDFSPLLSGIKHGQISACEAFIEEIQVQNRVLSDILLLCDADENGPLHVACAFAAPGKEELYSLLIQHGALQVYQETIGLSRSDYSIMRARRSEVAFPRNKAGLLPLDCAPSDAARHRISGAHRSRSRLVCLWLSALMHVDARAVERDDIVTSSVKSAGASASVPDVFMNGMSALDISLDPHAVPVFMGVNKTSSNNASGVTKASKTIVGWSRPYALPKPRAPRPARNDDRNQSASVVSSEMGQNQNVNVITQRLPADLIRTVIQYL